MKRFIHSIYAPILILIAVVCVFFWPVFVKGYTPFPGDLLLTQYSPWRHSSYGGYVAGAIPSKDQYFDVIRELYPWKTQVVSELKAGKIPLWNPYNFSGAPLLANYQSQVFYPLSVIYFIVPQISAWTMMVVSQPILGSIFMFLFASEIGLATGAAILAALLFNFSSFASVWMEFTTVWHTILWLPLFLFLVERAVKQKRLLFWQQILFMFALFSSITGGHPQDFINTFIIFIIYTIFRVMTAKGWPIKEKINLLLNPLSIVILIPFCLAAPQLLPTIELFRNSARVSHDYIFIINNLIVQLWQLPLLVVADFFGNPTTKSNIFGDYILKTLSIGVSGFYFAAVSLFSSVKSWHKTFFLNTAIIILLLTVRSPISELFYHFPIPILSTGTPTRILFVLMLSLSILAGFGFDEALKLKKIPFRALSLVWFIIVLLWIFVFKHPMITGTLLTPAAIGTMKRSMILATGMLGIISLVTCASLYRKKILYIAVIICIGELFYSFTKFNPEVPKLFAYPENNLVSFLKTHTGINRFWGYGTAQIEANFATQVDLFSPDGTDPLNLAWYNQLIQASTDGKVATSFNRTTRSDAQLLPGYGEDNLPENKFRLKLLDVMGVKYILDRAENPQNSNTFPSVRYKEVWHQNDWIVYENLFAAPRYFTTSDVRPYTDDKDFQNKFFADSFNPNKTVLVAAYDYKSIPKLTQNPSRVTLLSYAPQNIEFQVTTDSTQFLYISDTYDYGWKAEVNNKPARVYKANYAFRGVMVPKGVSKVSFTYQPQSFSTGVAVSAITAFILILYLTYLKRKK